jgi:hypothetical protein
MWVSVVLTPLAVCCISIRYTERLHHLTHVARQIARQNLALFPTEKSLEIVQVVSISFNSFGGNVDRLLVSCLQGESFVLRLELMCARAMPLCTAEMVDINEIPVPPDDFGHDTLWLRTGVIVWYRLFFLAVPRASKLTHRRGSMAIDINLHRTVDMDTRVIPEWRINSMRRTW